MKLVALVCVCSIGFTGTAAAQAYNWSGFYLGAQAGLGLDHSQTTVVDGTTDFPSGTVLSASHGNGVFGGGYLGLNHAIGQWVLGVDGEYSPSIIAGTGLTTGTSESVADDKLTMEWVATATGRLGFASDNWLLYGKGGLASAGFSGNGTINNSSGTTVATTTSSSTRKGWTVGAGLEDGITDSWSVKYEYDYANFGTASFDLTSTDVPDGPSTRLARTATSSLSAVTIGFAYHF